MLDTIIHKWLNIPYTLHAHVNRKVKKPRVSVVFLHGIGNSASVWNEVVEVLAFDIRAVSVDLLGFGQSAKPSWATYDAKTQAESLYKTLKALRLHGPIIIVGHSLGALVAVEFAKTHSLRVQALILCSPPFYVTHPGQRHLIPGNDDVLRKLYKTVHKNPQTFMKISQFATKYHLVNRSFNITSDNVSSYIAALEAMIINQTAYEDALRLTVPTQIIRGSLDPFVIAKNLKSLTNSNPHMKIRTITAKHEINHRYKSAIVWSIDELTSETSVK